jgi:hypothetical protein
MTRRKGKMETTEPNMLEQFIAERGLDEIAVMNYLQDQGRVISDNCIMACDVGNLEEAIKFLQSSGFNMSWSYA